MTGTTLYKEIDRAYGYLSIFLVAKAASSTSSVSPPFPLNLSPVLASDNVKSIQDPRLKLLADGFIVSELA